MMLNTSLLYVLHMLQVHTHDRLHLRGIEVDAKLSLRPSHRAGFSVRFVPGRATASNDEQRRATKSNKGVTSMGGTSYNRLYTYGVYVYGVYGVYSCTSK